jgi:hypothetical protein
VISVLRVFGLEGCTRLYHPHEFKDEKFIRYWFQVKLDFLLDFISLMTLDASPGGPAV